MRRFAFAGLAIALFVACQPPEPVELTEAEKAEIADAVREANADYWAAWARKDFDGYAEFYSSRSDEFPLLSYESFDAHRSRVMEIWDTLSTWEIREMEQPDVMVLGSDMAFMTGSALSLLTFTTENVREWEQDFAYVWVREDEGWKLAAAQIFTEIREPS